MDGRRHLAMKCTEGYYGISCDLWNLLHLQGWKICVPYVNVCCYSTRARVSALIDKAYAA